MGGSGIAKFVVAKGSFWDASSCPNQRMPSASILKFLPIYRFDETQQGGHAVVNELCFVHRD